MDGLELLWLLLPVAAASGWWLGRRSGAGPAPREAGDDLRSRYFRGINYVLNEQPDKAIEAFIELLEVDAETVETHLALGGLYRRRGEVDRAIRIHQNLVAREGLAPEQRHEALLELAQDYQAAGLFDRAESLFRELAGAQAFRVQALRQLIDIYEQEKDWERAIDTAVELEEATGNQLGHVIAQYHCELAERRRAAGDAPGALAGARRALRVHPSCVRASLLEARLLEAAGDRDGALRAFARVADQDPEFVQETVDGLVRCYRSLGRDAELEAHLERLAARSDGAAALLALARLHREREGPARAAAFLAAHLERCTSLRGLDALLGLELERATQASVGPLSISKLLTGRLLEERPAYRCQHCGFPARALHWQCPSCKHWSSVRPLQGLVEG